MPEFDLIARIRDRVHARADVLLGIGDDAALLRVPEGQALVVSCDTLNAGVHFPLDTVPADIGHKALAVNLSDLAAMAAQPAWCTLSLSLPEADESWIDAFLDGFLALAQTHGIALVGGDTTRGPFSICVTVHGLVPDALALRRSGAQAGDEVWLTGSVGDAAAALALRASIDPIDPMLIARLHRPMPRVAAGLALRGLAHACIDVSDGLLADLGHVLVASGVGARVELARLPTSAALAAAFGETERWPLQLAGGDDYELCFTAAPEQHEAIVAVLAAVDTPAQVIGRLTPAPGVRVIAADGSAYTPTRGGFQHFSGNDNE
jgi:thiamine-monophosphate kinase